MVWLTRFFTFHLSEPLWRYLINHYNTVFYSIGKHPFILATRKINLKIFNSSEALKHRLLTYIIPLWCYWYVTMEGLKFHNKCGSEKLQIFTWEKIKIEWSGQSFSLCSKFPMQKIKTTTPKKWKWLNSENCTQRKYNPTQKLKWSHLRSQ